MDDRQLLAQELPPLRWAVDGLIPEGACLLAGKAKSGKSWWAYQLAIAIADGTSFLGYETTQGEVLYLALEDSPRRMQERMRSLSPKRKPNGLLTIETEWPLASEGGYQELDSWLADHPAARLVVVDNQRRFEEVGYAYRRDSNIIQRASEMAMRHHVAMVLVFHMYKGPGVSKSSPDWVDKIQGSVGTTGAADAILGLYRDRNMKEGVLRVTGKDVPEQDVAMTFDRANNAWSRHDVTDTTDQKEMSNLRQDILRVVGGEPAISASDIGRAVGRDYNGVKAALWAMLERKQLVRISGQYFTPEQAAAIEAVEVAALPLASGNHFTRTAKRNGAK